jgi:hypothetical protein
MLEGATFPGIIAGRYQTIRLIAMGGMGAVYEVEHTSTGERLALKVLLSTANRAPEALARFKQEARASARIQSENVVRVTDADLAPELGGAPFLVMELLEGMNLERAAMTAPPRAATVIDWLRPVARAIDKAHRLGLVHRDLKPENLFLANQSDGPPRVKVLDFGIVKMVEEGTGATGTGQILGTPKYMAPEQATANGHITPATDRCALGLIAYRLLTGESYYQGGIMVVLGELLHGQLQAPSARGSRFGAAFDAWFLKACHRDPGQRFASAAEQIEALAAAVGVPTLPLETPSKRDTPFRVRLPSAGMRRVLLIAGSVAVSIAAVAAVAVAIRHVINRRRAEAVVCGLPGGGATAACGACLERACCQEAQRCSATEGCGQVERCIRACASGNAVCRGACYAAGGTAARLQREVETCRATACESQCLPAPWACLGHVKWQSSDPIPSSITIKTTAICTHCGAGDAPIAGGPGGSAISEASVRICSVADPPCAFPLAAGITAQDGTVALKIDTSLYRPPLAVFLEYRKPGRQDTLVNLTTPPVTADLEVGRVSMEDEKSEQEPTAIDLGTTYDPTRATVYLLTRDCNLQPAAKRITLTWLDGDAATVTRGYIAYTGGAIAVNLPINAAQITRVVARVSDTNQLVGIANVVVRARSNTVLRLVPTP